MEISIGKVTYSKINRMRIENEKILFTPEKVELNKFLNTFFGLGLLKTKRKKEIRGNQLIMKMGAVYEKKYQKNQ